MVESPQPTKFATYEYIGFLIDQFEPSPEKSKTTTKANDAKHMRKLIDWSNILSQNNQLKESYSWQESNSQLGGTDLLCCSRYLEYQLSKVQIIWGTRLLIDNVCMCMNVILLSAYNNQQVCITDWQMISIEKNIPETHMF